MVALATLLAACSGKKSDDQAQAAEVAEAAAEPEQDGLVGVKVGENQWRIPLSTKVPEGLEEMPDHGSGAGGGNAKKRKDETPLYVDGEPRAMMRFVEIPPWVETRWVQVGAGTEPVTVMRFNLAEYLASIGVDVRSIRELHAYGGRGRVSIIPGENLVRARKDFLFSFASGEGGKARFHWIEAVGATDSIDKIRQIAIYVDKEPPTYDAEQFSFVDETRQIIEELPYVAEKLRGGVRVLRDARLAAVIKRKKLYEDGVEPAEVIEDVPHYVLFDFLGREDVPVKDVAAIELLYFNDVVGRLEGAELAKLAGTLRFSAPPKSKGQVLIHLPGKEPVEVTAISLFSKRRARATHVRDVAPPAAKR